MAQHRPDSDADDLPQIDTPVIDMQDLEHNPGPQTRVPNKGVKVEPRMDGDDERDLAKEDEAALKALEEIEKSLHGQPPG
jgi:hypothetical protein